MDAGLRAGRLAAALGRKGVEAGFFFGSGGEEGAFMQAAEQRGWRPRLFLPGSLVGRAIFDAPAGIQGSVFLAVPTGPADGTPAGVSEYRALLDTHKLPARHPAFQVAAYAAARLLVEGLQRAGKDLSREKLIAALEGLCEFDTGVTPPIAYGPNRRIGALGAYIAALDLEKKTFTPVSDWTPPRGYDKLPG